MTAPEHFSDGPKQPARGMPLRARRLVCAALLALASAARAQDSLPMQPLTDAPRLELAQLGGPRLAVHGTADTSIGAAAPAFKPAWFTGSDAHKYLGLGSVLLVGLTAATAPHENECEHTCAANTARRQTSGTTHTRLARAAAAMAGATVATGLLVHWDDFHLRDGFSDPDNQHVLLGLAGSLLMLYAVNKSMHSTVPTQHAAFAEVGGAAMAIAIKLTW
jgi:hypothetical protein